MVSLKRERGWADTAHTTELRSGFCSVVRIGRSGGEKSDRLLDIFLRKMSLCTDDFLVEGAGMGRYGARDRIGWKRGWRD